MNGAWPITSEYEWFSITTTITWRMTGVDSRAWPHAAGAVAVETWALAAGVATPAAIAIAARAPASAAPRLLMCR